MRETRIEPGAILSRDPIVNAYLRDISRLPMLAVGEEVELARRKNNGDKEALKRLVEGNLRFVVSVAKKYQHHRMPIMDIINEGNIGLQKAAQKFDETRGFKFISYAVWWIRQSILQSLAENERMVRLPLNQIGSITKLNQAIDRFEQEYRREPSPEELEAILDIPEYKVRDTLAARKGTGKSLDDPLADGESGTLYDVMVDVDAPGADDNLTYESLRQEIARSLGQLKDREATILRMLYGIECKEQTLDEVGGELNLSRERVRQIKEKALRQLRGQKSRNLRSYLG